MTSKSDHYRIMNLENNMKNAIYTKIAQIQGKIKGLTKTKENKFQGYKYFGEDKAILLLKPLLDAEKIATT